MCYWNVFVYAIQQWYSARRLWKSNFVYAEGIVVVFAMPLRWHSYFFLLYSFWIEVPGSYPQDTCDGVIRTPVRVAIHETKIVCATKLFPLFSFSVSLKQPIITGIVHILHPNCKKLFGIPNMTEIIWWFHFFFVIFRYLHAIKTVTVLINHL